MGVTRKDYGINAVIKESNKALRLYEILNLPEGLTTEVLESKVVREIDQVYLDNLSTGTRLLFGNRVGYVDVINQNVGVTTDIVIKWKERGLVHSETYTASDILSNRNVHFLEP